ncbi:CopG family ribbon-helix-helix protein [Thiomonas arsenitoxydans]|uniref:Transcriptional regulator n=1 Tax=Thiomonas arsenitoxydans (strain DSM 22701 / CIP 110005 / 3As) TaxID=426114 RepID=D6CTT7_THIA3|nr:CopG family transcriptional regulator [Thiomonas arsenitoxydans]CAZ88706.1 putative transcriptional regulator [Thiomonas arsenitoxydans]
MAIVKPKGKASVVDAFIGGAPDAAPAPKVVKGVMLGNKRQITLTIAPELLARVDALAGQIGQSRAAVINLAIRQAVERGLTIEGLTKAS